MTLRSVENVYNWDEVGLREKVTELPQRVLSRFGKDYDQEGIELSGGQGQTMILMRTL